MAWRNIRLQLNWGSGCQCDITNFALLSMTSWPYNLSPYLANPVGTINDFNSGTMFGSGNDYVSGTKSSPSCLVNVHMTNVSTFSYGNEFITDDYRWGFVAAVDDETQKGFFAVVLKSIWNTDISWWAGNQPPAIGDSKRTPMYTLLTGNEVVTYGWKSYTSLSIEPLTDVQKNAGWKSYFDGPTMLLSYVEDDELEILDISQSKTIESGYFFRSPSFQESMPLWEGYEYTRRFNLTNGNYCAIHKTAGSPAAFLIRLYVPGSPTARIVYQGSFNASNGDPYLGFIYDDEQEEASINIMMDHGTYCVYNTLIIPRPDRKEIYEWLNGSAGNDQDSDDGRTNDEQGGDETDPVVHTPLNPLGLPTKGAAASGFIKLYKVSDQALNDLCEYMWDDSLIENLGRLFGDPRDIIVGISVFPIAPKSEDMSSANIKAGNLDTEIVADLLSTEYRSRPAGIARVAKEDCDFFAFAPYRRITLNLPYCGEHELDPSTVYGRKLKLIYHLSFFSGACVAEIQRSTDDGTYEPIFFFSGQMGIQIPISSEDYTRKIAAIISSGASLGSAMATGGVAGLASRGVREAGKLTSGSLSESISYNSGGGADSGFLSSQQPYLVIEDSIKAFDGQQPGYVGNVAYMVKTLNSCSGYVKCFHAHIHNSIATGEELKEIDSWLTRGVIIDKNGSSTPSDTPTVQGNIVINLLKNQSDYNVIGKTWDSTIWKIEGKLLYDNSISAPVIQIEGDCIGYNYCHIGLFKRFYYIDDVKVVRNGITEIHLKVDVLQSFKDDILASKASIERYSGKPNKYIEDPYVWSESKRSVKTVPFFEGGKPFDFSHSEDTYILTIAGT